ncbi:MAG: response regulator, partial [Bdellovibrionota bacterium]
MQKILIVDDNAAMRMTLKAILSTENYNVIEAVNGREALEILENEAVDLVISDLQMPEVDGISLLKSLRVTQSGLPFILVTGFSEIFEMKQAFELGANDFFTKPFNFKAILWSVGKLVRPNETRNDIAFESEQFGDIQTVASNKEKFCRVPIQDFVSSSGVQITVYVKLSEEKYIRVAHKGDILPPDKVESYKAKGVEHLYARKEDIALIVGFNLGVSKMMSVDSNIPIEKKMRFLRYTSDLVLENSVFHGLDPAGFRQASECLQLCIEIISESDSVFDLLDSLNSHSDWHYAHSLGVSIVSVMIGKKLGWEGQATFFKLSAAGLFHDIGEKEIEVDLLMKPRASLTAAERKMIETHPTRSKEILQSVRELSEDIIQVVYSHHEVCNGQGFPRRIDSVKIHPLAKVLSV